jgi:hypothetical protein
MVDIVQRGIDRSFSVYSVPYTVQGGEDNALGVSNHTGHADPISFLAEFNC